MEDIAKAAGKFITRDIFYVLSGLYILTALEQIDVLDVRQLFGGFSSEAINLILLLGSGYVLGFAVKELFAFCHITIEAHDFQPSWLDKRLWELHQRKPWSQPESFDVNQAYRELEKEGPLVRDRYQRTSDVVHVCSSAGTALTLCGILALIRIIYDLLTCTSQGPQRLVVGILSFMLGIVLVRMSRFQTMRRMKALSACIDRKR